MKTIMTVEMDWDKEPDDQTGKLKLDHKGLSGGIKKVRNLGVHPKDTGEPLRVHQL